MYQLIRTPDEALESFEAYDKSKLLFCDTETMTHEGKSKGGLYGRVRLFQVYQVGWKKALMYDCMFLDLLDLLDKLQPFKHVYHNASYDLHTVNCYTPETYLPADLEDTVYMARLALWEKGNRFGFYQCLEMCGLVDDTIRGMDKKENQKADWGGVLTPTMLKYAACDVLYLSLLYEHVKHTKELESYQLDIDNLLYAVKYSRRGIPIDEKRVEKMLLENTIKYEETLEVLPVNPNSPKQCCELLGTDKSDMDTLEHLRLTGNTAAGLIRDARQLSKTVMFLKKYRRPLIKGFYNPCGAITGRFSCTGGDRFDHDNTQQIPRRILECLVPLEGRCFVYSDYAGLELRMSVAWIGEPTMHRLIMQGVDLHSYTGSILYHKPPEELTEFERMIGKICNFLLIYGGSVYILQATIRAWGGILMEYGECKELYDKWFDEYDYFKEWHEMTKKMLRVYGYQDVNTALGRNVRAFKLNDALNIPPQGSSSEVTKMSLKYMNERYGDEENLISTIHDSNTMMPLIEEAPLWIERLDECMNDAWNYVVSHTAIPDLPMPKEAVANDRWIFKDDVCEAYLASISK
jgi:DNA polymerase I-like protein with 3'-5' exonuclease and polymerase domains